MTSTETNSILGQKHLCHQMLSIQVLKISNGTPLKHNKIKIERELKRSCLKKSRRKDSQEERNILKRNRSEMKLGLSKKLKKKSKDSREKRKMRKGDSKKLHGKL